MKYLVTGGAGFIGSALVRYLIQEIGVEVANLDKLTYAGDLESLCSVEGAPNYRFERVDICDAESVESAFERHQPNIVVHLAAESHVDRSIDNPAAFVETNVLGTYVMLDVARRYWTARSSNRGFRFLFHHVSTDEVYGDLGQSSARFLESTPYAPSSPYAASKAASDHLVRAWHRTYGLPTVVTNCSNNFGPYQFPEKLIPLTIINAIRGRSLPVYGKGEQVRDWLYVEDHARALVEVGIKGRIGETYNIGADSARPNIEVVKTICRTLDANAPQYRPSGGRYENLITFVEDRPGHDVRYAIDASKVAGEIGWRAQESFDSGIAKTVTWYLENRPWWQRILDGNYYGERLGLSHHV